MFTAAPASTRQGTQHAVNAVVAMVVIDALEMVHIEPSIPRIDTLWCTTNKPWAVDGVGAHAGHHTVPTLYRALHTGRILGRCRG